MDLRTISFRRQIRGERNGDGDESNVLYNFLGSAASLVNE